MFSKKRKLRFDCIQKLSISSIRYYWLGLTKIPQKIEWTLDKKDLHQLRIQCSCVVDDINYFNGFE